MKLSRQTRFNLIGEVKVLCKIMPINELHSSIFWVNDTVEVFRSCPAYAILSDEVPLEEVTIIGRNFQNTSALTCRFRIEDIGREILESFVNGTRIHCRLPIAGCLNRKE